GGEVIKVEVGNWRAGERSFRLIDISYWLFGRPCADGWPSREWPPPDAHDFSTYEKFRRSNSFRRRLAAGEPRRSHRPRRSKRRRQNDIVFAHSWRRFTRWRK